MINFKLSDSQAIKLISVISKNSSSYNLLVELKKQFSIQYIEPIIEKPEVKKPTALYHSINNSGNTYFEYNPKEVVTALCQKTNRQSLSKFKNNYFEKSGRVKMGAINAMLFSYTDYSTKRKTNKSIVFGTAMRDMGIWINKPYVNKYVINMVCTLEDKLIVQDGIGENEYTKAKFIVSGYACTKNGVKDSSKHSNSAHLLGRTNRTIYGQKANGNMVMITMKKAKAIDCQNLCIAMGVDNSIMLDGGGSTRFDLFGKRMSWFNGYRKIANSLVLYSYLKDRTEVRQHNKVVYWMERPKPPYA